MFLGNKSLALDFILLSFIIARFQSSLPHVMVFTYQTLGRCTYIWSKDNKPEGNIRVNIECIVCSRVLLNPIILDLSASSSAKVPLFGECPSLLGSSVSFIYSSMITKLFIQLADLLWSWDSIFIFVTFQKISMPHWRQPFCYQSWNFDENDRQSFGP